MDAFYDVFFFLAIGGGFLMALSLGGNDVANAMASAVGSKALTIRWALVIAAAMNLIGACFLGGSVCATISKGIVNPEGVPPEHLVIGMFAALLTAGAWVLISTLSGFPVSSTHSIVGGVLGMGLLAAGTDAVQWGALIGIALSWVLTPILAGILSYIMLSVIRALILKREHILRATRTWAPVFIAFTAGLIIGALIFHTPVGEKFAHDHTTYAIALVVASLVVFWFIGIYVVNAILGPREEEDTEAGEKVFRRVQILTSAYVALSQGANDVANAMGPVCALYLLAKYHDMPTNPEMPLWLLGVGGVGIAIGIGLLGQRVIKTVGEGITKLNNTKGYSVDFSVASTVLVASIMGMPVSSTTVAVGAVTGVGASEGLHNVNIKMLLKIFAFWAITVPIAAATSMLFYVILKATILPEVAAVTP